MSNLAELEDRLRDAAGAEPDTEQALDEVMNRIDRRIRRVKVSVAAVVTVLLAATAVWMVERPGSEDSSVLVGEPPETSTPDSDPASVSVREMWRARDVGMSGSSLPSGGALTATRGDMVFAAEGFGNGQSEPVGRISGLDRGTGSVRWTTDLGGPAFLQGATDMTVIANTQHERLFGLDATDGTIIWELELADLGLEGYGAVTSAVTETTAAVGVSANNEGDVRPPVVLGIESASGNVQWTSALTDGTDLNWGTPPVSGGDAVFTTTLSHPESAERNVAHLIGLADGTIGWSVDMGDSQGFSNDSATIGPETVTLPAHPDIMSVQRADGTINWTRPGHGAQNIDDDLWMFLPDGVVASIDPRSGDVVDELETPDDQVSQLIDLGTSLIGLFSRAQLTVVRPDGEIAAQQQWDAPLADAARFDRDIIVVATEDGAVSAFAVTTDGTGTGGAAPTTSGERGLPGRALTPDERDQYTVPPRGTALSVRFVPVGETMPLSDRPGEGGDVAADLSPLATGAFTGRDRLVDDRLWLEIETDDQVGWLDRRTVVQLSDPVVVSLADTDEPMVAADMDDLADLVAVELAADDVQTVVIIDRPDSGDEPHAITADVRTAADDSTDGFRLRIQASPTRDGMFTATQAERSDFCARAVFNGRCT